MIFRPAVQHGAEHKADDALRAGIKNGGEGAEKNRDQAHGRKYGQAFAKSILQGLRCWRPNCANNFPFKRALIYEPGGVCETRRPRQRPKERKIL